MELADLRQLVPLHQGLPPLAAVMAWSWAVGCRGSTARAGVRVERRHSPWGQRSRGHPWRPWGRLRPWGRTGPLRRRRPRRSSRPWQRGRRCCAWRMSAARWPFPGLSFLACRSFCLGGGEILIGGRLGGGGVAQVGQRDVRVGRRDEGIARVAKATLRRRRRRIADPRLRRGCRIANEGSRRRPAPPSSSGQGRPCTEFEPTPPVIIGVSRGLRRELPQSRFSEVEREVLSPHLINLARSTVLRLLDGRMPSTSRYLATVRRAISMPCALEQLDDLLIRVRVLRRPRRDELLDVVLHRLAGDVVAAGRARWTS